MIVYSDKIIGSFISLSDTKQHSTIILLVHFGKHSFIAQTIYSKGTVQKQSLNINLGDRDYRLRVARLAVIVKECGLYLNLIINNTECDAEPLASKFLTIALTLTDRIWSVQVKFKV